MKTLVIDAKVLTPTQDGRSVRMRSFLNILQELNCDITFVGSKISSWAPFDRSLDQDIQAMEATGIRVISEQEARSVEEHLERNGSEYDLIILSGLFVTDRHINSARQYAPQATIVYDTVDLVHVREYRQAKMLRNAVHLEKALRLKRREVALANEADFALVVSDLEKAVMESLAPSANVIVVSNIHEVWRTKTAFAERQDMMFVGSYQHRPNIDAMLYFVNEVMPLLRGYRQPIKLYVVGSSPPDEIVDLTANDVVVTGAVPDLMPYYESVRLTVAPLRFGAGVKGKVLASMGYGVPTVITSVAAEGLHVVDGRQTLIADTPRDFGNAIISLYHDEVLWQRMANSGVRLVQNYFSTEVANRQLTDLLERIRAANHE